MGLNLSRLDTASARAGLMWDYYNDPRGLVAELTLAIAELTDSGAVITEAQCGAYSGIMGAMMMRDVYLRTLDVDKAPTYYDFTEAQSGAGIIEHAGNTHNDEMADFILGDTQPNFTETIKRIDSWVTTNLTAQLAEVIELFPYSTDFARWEA